MAYQGKLQSGQTIVLENQDGQTVIRVFDRNQRQSSSVTTGQWQGPPTLFQVGDGAVVELKTADGSVFYGANGGQLHSLDRRPALDGAEQIDLEEVEDGTGKSEMKPMQPMRPM